MAEKTLNTRIKLRYASFSEWQSSGVVLLRGEVALCYVEANNAEVKNTAPTVLFKVGDGTHAFKDLQWASARAADVYDWAKAENLIIEKSGTGNVVASISWDTANKKFVYTTAAVATAEGLSDLQTAVSSLTNELNGIKERLSTIEGNIANNAAAIETINGDANTDGSIAKAVATEATNRTNADNALSERITANASAITALTNGIDPDKIDGVKELIKYVEDHGPEVEGIHNNISTLQGYFEDGAAKKAKDADTLDGKDSTYFAVKTEVNSQISDVNGKINETNSKISTLETEVNGKISTLEGSLSTANTNIEGLTTRVETVEGYNSRITAIEQDYLKSTDFLILDCGSYN